MNVQLSAQKAKMGGREYYITRVALSEIPRIFTASNSTELPPEERHQRPINKSRISQIADYMEENQDGYFLPALTATYQGDPTFEACDFDASIGRLNFDLTKTKFLMHDGQHRAGGIAAEIQRNADLGEDQIPVAFLKYENLSRSQQLFTDVNQNAVRTSLATNLLFNHRDEMARIIRELIKSVPLFANLVDMERSAPSRRSTALFSLKAIYDASVEFLKPVTDLLPSDAPMLYEDKKALLEEFWNRITDLIPAWKDVMAGRSGAAELRDTSVSTHATVLSAIGSVAGTLRASDPNRWKAKLKPLADVDWNKTNKKWLNAVIVGNSVVSSRNARAASKQILRRELGLPDVGIPPAESNHTQMKSRETVAATPRKPAAKAHHKKVA